jgi:hypothetical protein
MADSDVIRAFLVQLGFQVNQGQLSKFTSTLSGTTKQVAALGAAIAATVVAVEAMVYKVSDDLEKLYFSSQRSRTTVSNLHAMRYAMRGIGLAADAGQAAIEGLARAMRTNPGITALLNNMGIATKDRDTNAILNDLIGKLSQMPFYLAQQYGQLFGIDPETLRAMIANYNKMAAAIDDHNRRLKQAGVDVDELARRSHEFMNTWRLLIDNLDIFATKIADKLMPAAKQMLEWTNSFVVALTNLDSIIASNFTPEMGRLSAALDELTSAWRQLWGVVGPFFDAVMNVYGPYAKEAFGATIDLLSDSIRILADQFRGLTALLTGDTAAAWKHFMSSATTAINAAVRAAQPLINVWNKLFGTGESASPAAAPSGAPSRAPSSPATNDNNGRLPLGLRQNNPGNLRWWAGVERQNGYAKFETMQQGLSAMAQQLVLYGKRGINTLEGIVARYAPAFENNVKAYVKSLEQQTGFSSSQKLDLNDHATLAKVMKAMIGVEQGRQPFTDAEIMAAVNSRLGIPNAALGGGGNAVTINQENTFNISGTGSAQEIGRAVAAEQGRVNGDLQRNLQGAVQ